MSDAVDAVGLPVMAARRQCGAADTPLSAENQEAPSRAWIVPNGTKNHIGGIRTLKNFSIPVIYGHALAMSMLQGRWKKRRHRRTIIQTVSPATSSRLGSTFK